ncbi:phosphodiester glycosidase family protein [Flaviaesturariibacter amylovorans]|uniref:Phosphodiester glycosidase domain-containing protein n=1 Tax=Flaviaesturariibacter amylovorans TaxID=1084520 RepID=A0ABP8G7L2_9BACT
MTRLLLPLLLLLPFRVPAQRVVAQRGAPAAVRMYWKAPDGKPYATFERLLAQRPRIRFAMNGGMFSAALAPVGLYVESGRVLRPLKHYSNPKVNFGLQPQGVFGIRGGKAFVEPARSYTARGVTFATQSAPMLVLNGKRNPALPRGLSLIRNGVGLLPDGQVLLAISEEGVTFWEFADWFVKQGCTSALYLDGNVSEYYKPGHLPAAWFAVMIAVE